MKPSVARIASAKTVEIEGVSKTAANAMAASPQIDIIRPARRRAEQIPPP
jgi:hypothetical protein